MLIDTASILFMSESGPNPKQVDEWLSGTNARMEDIQRQIEPLHKEMSALRERHKLLLELLQTMEPSDQTPAREALTSLSLSSFSEVPRHLFSEVPRHSFSEVSRRSFSEVPRGGRRERTRDRVHNEVVQVLRMVNEPIHINDLALKYETEGFRIPGQGKPANLSVHLSGWPDIVTGPERGMYSLNEEVNEESDEETK